MERLNNETGERSLAELLRLSGVRWGTGASSGSALPTRGGLGLLGREEFTQARSRGDVLELGLAELDASLPDGGLPTGRVVELAARGAAGATQVALASLRAAQQRGRLQDGETPWCAFLDTTRSLHGPGVAHAGLELERLLVVRPEAEAVGRVALRLAESRCFAAIVVDLAGVPGLQRNGLPAEGLSAWPRLVRRLALALEGTRTLLVLLTDLDARRPLPLPVALRLELECPRPQRLRLKVAKDWRGRIEPAKTLTHWLERTRGCEAQVCARTQEQLGARERRIA